MSIGSFVSGYLPMLRLGNFNFSLNSAVFQEMRRTSDFKWEAQDRVGQRPALQFTGLGEDTITLPGVTYPEYKGSSNAMEQMRKMAAAGEPYLLLDSQGRIYGRWVITNVEETRGTFAVFSQPKKIEFNVTIKCFDGDTTSLLETLMNMAISAAKTAILS